MLQITLIAIAALAGVFALWFWITMIRTCLRDTQPGSRQRHVWLPIVTLGKHQGRGMDGRTPYDVFRDGLDWKEETKTNENEEAAPKEAT